MGMPCKSRLSLFCLMAVCASSIVTGLVDYRLNASHRLLPYWGGGSMEKGQTLQPSTPHCCNKVLIIRRFSLSDNKRWHNQQHILDACMYMCMSTSMNACQLCRGLWWYTQTYCTLECLWQCHCVCVSSWCSTLTYNFSDLLEMTYCMFFLYVVDDGSNMPCCHGKPIFP